ncbi:MAG: hypothetical protein WBA38_09730 [Gordonia sp. (in: high G+C Gram-positive bacteria)]|uniref:hypothetical protein n=1 Tax=Gordonia sp. (in: high G+C Gram-positive bacteria) TaxID=84139 RepID=UPI003C719898
MSSSSHAGPLSVLSPTVRAAVQLERETDRSTWRPRHVAVVPLDENAPTSVVAALIALAGTRLLTEPVVAVDPSPLRTLTQLLGGSTSGHLARLAADADSLRERRAVDGYVDTATATGTPLVSLQAYAGHLAPAEFSPALNALKRRHRGLVMDVAPPIADTLMAPALSAASLVVAVTSSPTSPPWLFSVANPLTPYLRAGTLTVAHPFSDVGEGVAVNYGIHTPTMGLGIRVNPDGTWNLPINAVGIDFDSGDLSVTRAAIVAGRAAYAPRD